MSILPGSELASQTKILPSVCPLDCPDTCSLEVTIQQQKLISVKGSYTNPYTAGVICNKVARAYPEFIHGETRLTTPLKRLGARGSGTYIPIDWDEALNLIYQKFTDAIETFGPQSILPLNYAGPHGELAAGSMDRRFFYRLGASLLHRTPLCAAVRRSAYTSLFGTVPGMPPEQAIHSDLILVWGNNVTVSNLHFTRILKTARANGAKLVVIDPKRIKIAEQADFYLQIQPGTDICLAMALAAELERQNALDMRFIAEWTLGFEPYIETARSYSIETVQQICGISAEQFYQLVALYKQAKNVSLSFGNGIERGCSGGSSLRAMMALQALTGNFGRLGAGIIANSGWVAPKTSSRLQRPDLVPAGTRMFNILDVADKLLDETLDPPIMALMIYNHNPVCTHPDQANLIRALERKDLFIVGCDIVMTDSMAYADVILPAASHFECDDIYGAYGQNYLQRAAPVIPCVGQALPNTEIFRRLAYRFGFSEPLFQEDDQTLMDQAFDENDPRLEGYRPSEIPLDRALLLNHLDGEAVILCKTVFPNTESGKIELFSKDLETRFGYGLPRYKAINRTQPFTLISPSSAKRTNATFGGCSLSEGSEILEINPQDAADKELKHGALVLVWNEQAEITLQVSISDAILPGILYTPKGSWCRSSKTGRTVNALISSSVRADIEEGACYNETFVDIKAY